MSTSVVDSQVKGTVSIVDREMLKMNGVKNVLGFDEGFVALETELGEVSIEGEGMKIETLSEGGEISVKGRIDSVSFSAIKHKRGFLSGIFG